MSARQILISERAVLDDRGPLAEPHLSQVAELLKEIEQELDAKTSPHRVALGDLGMNQHGFVPLPYSDAAMDLWRDLLARDPDDVVTLHHLAIASHAKAIDLEASPDPVRSDQLWTEAQSLWRKLIDLDSFWEWVARSGGQKTSSPLVAALRERLPALLVRMHLDIAFDENTLNHRAQFHVGMARGAPFDRAALAAAQEAVYEPFSRSFPDELWTGHCDPGTVRETCERLVAFLELDAESVPAATDLLRLQMLLVRARSIDLAAVGSSDAARGQPILRDLADSAVRCAPYLSLLVKHPATLEGDLAESLVRWHRVMGDVSRSLKEHARAVELYDAPEQASVGGDDIARCRAGAAECQALLARQLAPDDRDGARRELVSLERRRTLTTWSCLYAAQAYAELGEYRSAEGLCERGEQIEAPANGRTELIAECEQGRLHLREMRSALRIRRLLEEARSRMSERRFDRALAALDQVAGIDPSSKPALFLRIQCLIAQKLLDQAEEAMKTFETLARDDHEGLAALDRMRQEFALERPIAALLLAFKQQGIDGARLHVDEARRNFATAEQASELSRILSIAAVRLVNDELPPLSEFAETVKRAMTIAGLSAAKGGR